MQECDRVDLVVRSATETDLPSMARMAAELVRMHHAMDPERFFLAKGIERGYRDWFAQELQKSEAILLVAAAHQELIGYCYGRVESRDWNLLLDRHAALHDIYVNPDARRCGAATQLVEGFAARVAALGAPRIVLSTAHSNEKAQALFEKLGFRRTMIEMTRELEP
jgi:ribosomal protein S18 acetylase RimI-like enzyme